MVSDVLWNVVVSFVDSSQYVCDYSGQKWKAREILSLLTLLTYT
jgi:hypothetical protein